MLWACVAASPSTDDGSFAVGAVPRKRGFTAPAPVCHPVRRCQQRCRYIRAHRRENRAGIDESLFPVSLAGSCCVAIGVELLRVVVSLVPMGRLEHERDGRAAREAPAGASDREGVAAGRGTAARAGR